MERFLNNDTKIFKINQITNYKKELEILLKEELNRYNDKVIDIINNLLNLEVKAEDINAAKISRTLKSLQIKMDESTNKLIKKLILKWKGIIQKNKIEVINLSSDEKDSNLESPELSLNEIENINKIIDPNKEKIKVFRNQIEKDEKDRSRRNIKLLLYDSLLKNKEESDPEDVYKIVLDIEEGLKNELFQNQNQKSKYLNQVKIIINNLNQNPEFVDDILTGKLTGENLATMNSLDFASESTKQRRLKLIEDAFNSRRLDWNRIHNPGAIGLYKCGKCKTFKTTYYQAQIRRADEPMTTFVSCLECNHSWKF